VIFEEKGVAFAEGAGAGCQKTEGCAYAFCAFGEAFAEGAGVAGD
jgi:hypothetical protein